MKLDESIKIVCEQITRKTINHAKEIHHGLSTMEIFDCLMQALEETYSLVKNLSYNESINNIIEKELERLNKWLDIQKQF